MTRTVKCPKCEKCYFVINNRPKCPYCKADYNDVLKSMNKISEDLFGFDIFK